MDIVPSEEQEDIITKFLEGNNLSIITPAGGAKTTTAFLCATRVPQKQILWLTYNSILKEEIRAKTRNYPHIEAHNFHAFGVKYIDPNCYGDQFYSYIQNYTRTFTLG